MTYKNEEVQLITDILNEGYTLNDAYFVVFVSGKDSVLTYYYPNILHVGLKIFYMVSKVELNLTGNVLGLTEEETSLLKDHFLVNITIEKEQIIFNHFKKIRENNSLPI